VLSFHLDKHLLSGAARTRLKKARMEAQLTRPVPISGLAGTIKRPRLESMNSPTRPPTPYKRPRDSSGPGT
jgi:hypothetical protein